MNIIVLVYLVVCVVLLAFDIIFLTVKRMRNHRFYPKMDKFEQQAEEEIGCRKKEGAFSGEFKESLTKKLGKTKYLIALQNVMTAHPESRDFFKPYLYACMDKYKKKSDYEQAYYAYVISTLGYEEAGVPKEFASGFWSFLDSKSLYTFFNAVNAVYEFGDEKLLLAVVSKIDERAGFYHKKLFVDGLLQARVDRESFGKKLMEHFDGYSDFTKGCVLDYLRFAGVEASDFCMGLMKKQEENHEIQYAAYRYFIKYPCGESKKYFEELLKKQDAVWIEQMLAIQGLSSYDEPEIRALIKEKITSRNWYVRVNTADYLRKYGLEKSELAEIIAWKDRYTNEILLYQYRDDEEMSAYITEMVEKLEKEGEQ